MFNKLYYCTSLKLKEGSIIEKGLHPLDFKKGDVITISCGNILLKEYHIIGIWEEIGGISEIRRT